MSGNTKKKFNNRTWVKVMCFFLAALMLTGAIIMIVSFFWDKKASQPKDTTAKINVAAVFQTGEQSIL